ncbi:hypothetical protein WKW79_22010 [Variovorax robiniae]|uniref:Uncharacterized protein n=1 Tax=Variovorax robiniae TaxID=1836199 RepID=A0ABU8XBQ8_9BURK
MLADLGGHKPPGISGGMIAVACCIVAIGIGAGFWATSGATKPAIATVATAPAPTAAPASSAAPAPPAPAAVAAEELKPSVPALTALNLESARPAGTGVAKISDEFARESRVMTARTAVPPKAAPPLVAATKATASGASKAGSDKPRKVAATKPVQKQASAKQVRQHTDVVGARTKVHVPGKSGSTAVAKTRDEKRVARSAPPTARKNTDPDTDLLAAMLRRNGGGPQ